MGGRHVLISRGGSWRENERIHTQDGVTQTAEKKKLDETFSLWDSRGGSRVFLFYVVTAAAAFGGCVYVELCLFIFVQPPHFHLHSIWISLNHSWCKKKNISLRLKQKNGRFPQYERSSCTGRIRAWRERKSEPRTKVFIHQEWWETKSPDGKAPESGLAFSL